VARDAAAWLAFWAATLVWGTTWLAIKVGYSGLDPLWSASLRFLIAAAVFALLILVQGRRVRVTAQDVKLTVFVGGLLFGFNYGVIYWSEQFLGSGMTAVLFATMPVFVGVLGAWLLPTERWTRRQALGVILGFLGVVLIYAEHVRLDSATAWPMLLVVAGASAAALTTVATRRWGRQTPNLVLNGGAMAVGALLLLAAALLSGERIGAPTTASSWLSIAWLSVFGSVVAFLLYMWLLKQWPATRTSLLTLLTPIVALLAGALVLDERPGLVPLLGAALVLSGVWISLYKWGSSTTVASLKEEKV
jgi:drug/metabolite transporter (DMT)-like permease